MLDLLKCSRLPFTHTLVSAGRCEVEIFSSFGYMHSLDCVLNSHCVGGSKLVIKQRTGAVCIPQALYWAPSPVTCTSLSVAYHDPLLCWWLGHFQCDRWGLYSYRRKQRCRISSRGTEKETMSWKWKPRIVQKDILFLPCWVLKLRSGAKLMFPHYT